MTSAPSLTFLYLMLQYLVNDSRPMTTRSVLIITPKKNTLTLTCYVSSKIMTALVCAKKQAVSITEQQHLAYHCYMHVPNTLFSHQLLRDSSTFCLLKQRVGIYYFPLKRKCGHLLNTSYSRLLRNNEKKPEKAIKRGTQRRMGRASVPAFQEV